MRLTRYLRCTNLRTLGLDGSRPYTAAEIKAAFVEKAKSAHPDAGGDAAQFRRLKDAYDALRGGNTNGAAAGTHQHASYAKPYRDAGASARSTQQSARPHIYTERYNDGDAKAQSEKVTWDYGSGTRYANTSTRSFYRPYSSNYYDPSATGFTRQEVARAELAMRLHMIKRVLWNCLIYGSALYLLYEYWPYRERPLSTDYGVGLDKQEKARREGELRLMQPHLQTYWSDAEKARYVEEWNNRFRDREHAVTTGHSTPFTGSRVGSSWSGVPVSDSAFLSVAKSSSSANPSPDTYCDMADEDVDAD